VKINNSDVTKEDIDIIYLIYYNNSRSRTSVRRENLRGGEKTIRRGRGLKFCRKKRRLRNMPRRSYRSNKDKNKMIHSNNWIEL
jgi:hypothetical protein